MTMENSAYTRRGAGLLRVRRTRGALSGLLLMALGVWGAIIPFVGPYFDYSYSPSDTWTWTTGRLVLEVLPGAAAFFGGLLLLMTANRAVALFGGWLAAAGGVWYVVGPPLGTLWSGSSGDAGTPLGDHTSRVVEQIGFFSGLGAAILLLGAHAAGRVSIRALSDVRAAERHRVATAAAVPVADETVTRAPVEHPTTTTAAGPTERTVATDRDADHGNDGTLRRLLTRSHRS